MIAGNSQHQFYQIENRTPKPMAVAPTTSSTAPLVAAAACNSGQPVAPLIAAAPALAEPPN